MNRLQLTPEGKCMVFIKDDGRYEKVLTLEDDAITALNASSGLYNRERMLIDAVNLYFEDNKSKIN